VSRGRAPVPADGSLGATPGPEWGATIRPAWRPRRGRNGCRETPRSVTSWVRARGRWGAPLPPPPPPPAPCGTAALRRGPGGTVGPGSRLGRAPCSSASERPPTARPASCGWTRHPPDGVGSNVPLQPWLRIPEHPEWRASTSAKAACPDGRMRPNGGGSSVGQSSGLIIRRSLVRVQPAPPHWVPVPVRVPVPSPCDAAPRVA
jgi:hypothetical protein